VVDLPLEVRLQLRDLLLAALPDLGHHDPLGGKSRAKLIRPKFRLPQAELDHVLTDVGQRRVWSAAVG
jgi:hypothetical protein